MGPCISVQVKFCSILKEEQCQCVNGGGEGGSMARVKMIISLGYFFFSCKGYNVHSTSINRTNILNYDGEK